jgi:phosphoglucomutase
MPRRSIDESVVKISPLAGKPATPEMLVDVAKLVMAYYADALDPIPQCDGVAVPLEDNRILWQR